MSAIQCKNKIICIYGPTASLKTQFAILLAQKIGGIVINADATQIYKEVPILTSQPNKKECDVISHKLYGIKNLIDNFSVNKWIILAILEINLARQLKQSPIFVGGTGMYLHNLLYGISKMPKINQITKNAILVLSNYKKYENLHSILSKHDMTFSNQLNKNDKIRIVKGLEVIMSTNNSILKWRKINDQFYDEKNFLNIYIRPKHDYLYKNINNRLVGMIKFGIENEIKNVLTRHSKSKLPKIIGLNNLFEYLSGVATFKKILILMQKSTKKYAKKQLSWFNNKLKHDYIGNLTKITEYFL